MKFAPTGDLSLDVLARLGESARFETVEAEVRKIEGTEVRIATPAALYRMKKGTIDNRVQKFRSIEEMNKAPIRRKNLETFLLPSNPRGVFKFRSIEALNPPPEDRP